MEQFNVRMEELLEDIQCGRVGNKIKAERVKVDTCGGLEMTLNDQREVSAIITMIGARFRGMFDQLVRGTAYFGVGSIAYEHNYFRFSAHDGVMVGTGYTILNPNSMFNKEGEWMLREVYMSVSKQGWVDIHFWHATKELDGATIGVTMCIPPVVEKRDE